MSKSKAYHAELIENLRDPREAEEYLNAALEEDDPELFLVALRNVAEAQGGVAELADKTKFNRESLYKMLSEHGNPELKSLDALLHALGFRLAVTPIDRERSGARKLIVRAPRAKEATGPPVPLPLTTLRTSVRRIAW